MDRVSRKYRHRVESKSVRPAPLALPKEVEPVAPRVYRDRFDTEYEVVWNGAKTDFSLIAPREQLR